MPIISNYTSEVSFAPLDTSVSQNSHQYINIKFHHPTFIHLEDSQVTSQKNEYLIVAFAMGVQNQIINYLLDPYQCKVLKSRSMVVNKPVSHKYLSSPCTPTLHTQDSQALLDLN